MAGKERLLTGLQPSGDLHIGNYFGALRQVKDLYQTYDTYLMVVDYHALTSLKDPAALRANTIRVVKDYLAVGIDPAKMTLFKQSDVPEHTELAWILNCQVTVPFLMQAHSYKDKVAKGLEANAGLFTYPILMAADILLYDTDIVPVGEDQRQHIEYAREAAVKFNTTYGVQFKQPKEMIFTDVGIIPGTDGQKMSKSYKNTIPLFGTKDEIVKAVMSIVTDSSGERLENVYAIHKLFKSENELTTLYSSHSGNYKALKEALIEDIEAFIAPMRGTRDALTEEDVKRVLREGGEKARSVASAKMKQVKEAIGIL
jgi:tryptophanyl-tRNA synthetase